MRRAVVSIFVVGIALLTSLAVVSAKSRGKGKRAQARLDAVAQDNAIAMIDEGRQTFRFDTFGDETFWGDTLRLHEAIQAALTPRKALELGLKVDAAALPRDLRRQLKAGDVDLEDPATTLALLQLNAVVGVTGFFGSEGTLSSVGIQCAICHSTVDDALLPGVGNRLDGWANRDLDIGKIAALAPNLQPVADLLGVDVATVKAVLESWGPGKFDAELLLDGKGFRDGNLPAATLIPPAFGLSGVNLHTWPGWGGVTYLNAFVANIEMHGQGTFYDPRLNDPVRFPVAARAGFANIRNQPDRITGKLAALHFYQLSIPAPTPPADSFDAAAAERGKGTFEGKARCATCHVPPLFTEPGWNRLLPRRSLRDAARRRRSLRHALRPSAPVGAGEERPGRVSEVALTPPAQSESTSSISLRTRARHCTSGLVPASMRCVSASTASRSTSQQ